MALSKKKSRPITVDNTDYRFQISTTKIDNDWNYKLNLTIDCAEEHSGCLQVTGLLTRNFWADFPDIKKDNGINHYPVIKPSQVETIILMAISKGWKPKVKGPLFEMELESNEILK